MSYTEHTSRQVAHGAKNDLMAPLRQSSTLVSLAIFIILFVFLPYLILSFLQNRDDRSNASSAVMGVATECDPPLIDWYPDGITTVQDHGAFVSAFNQPVPPQSADLNCDGKVDTQDYEVFSTTWKALLD